MFRKNVIKFGKVHFLAKLLGKCKWYTFCGLQCKLHDADIMSILRICAPFCPADEFINNVMTSWLQKLQTVYSNPEKTLSQYNRSV